MSLRTVRLVIATTNLGKLREIGAILREAPIELCRPIDCLGYGPTIVEDGDTFESNAKLKAQAVAQLTGEFTIADDSGLEVDALLRAPGVRSARYAGENASDAENNQALLLALGKLGLTQSTARFRCAMALVAPDGALVAERSGVCEGVVQSVQRGSHGFGYDPLFVVSKLGKRTMAELEQDEKNQVSHRGRALTAMLPVLLGLPKWSGVVAAK